MAFRNKRHVETHDEKELPLTKKRHVETPDEKVSFPINDLPFMVLKKILTSYLELPPPKMSRRDPSLYHALDERKLLNVCWLWRALCSELTLNNPTLTNNSRNRNGEKLGSVYLILLRYFEQVNAPKLCINYIKLSEKCREILHIELNELMQPNQTTHLVLKGPCLDINISFLYNFRNLTHLKFSDHPYTKDMDDAINKFYPKIPTIYIDIYRYHFIYSRHLPYKI